MTSTSVRARLALLERYVVPAAFVFGVLIRAIWSLTRPNFGRGGEAYNVAVAVAQGRGIADAYFIGSGPTAHLLPTAPLLTGSVYRLFGINSALSEFVLEAIALAFVFGSFALFARSFRRVGLPRIAVSGALVFLCCVPLFMGQEATDFRYWEGGLAIFLQALFLDRLTAYRTASPRSAAAWLGVTAAAVSFVCPPLGLASVLGTAIALLRRRAWWPIAVASLAFVATIAVPVALWTARNQQVFHRTIMMRSNLWLELAIANHPAAIAGDDKETFTQRMNDVHPSSGQRGRARYRAIGEIAHFDALHEETGAWIGAHPGEFARLSARHFRQVLFPSAWQFEIGSGKYSGARALHYSAISLLGLIGLAVATWRVDRRYLYFLVHIGVIALGYAPFQPMARYIYLNYAISVFGAVTALWLAGAALHQRRAVSRGTTGRSGPASAATPATPAPAPASPARAGSTAAPPSPPRHAADR